jgi:HME family heavy-metal exporter
MKRERDGWVLRILKVVGGWVIRFSLRFRFIVLGSVAFAAVVSVVIVLNMGRNFLPPFNEGSVIVSLILPPGTSLNESDRMGTQAEKSLQTLDYVLQVSRRTGRAELDEHAEGVNVSELILVLDPKSSRTRQQQLKDIRDLLDKIPGIESTSGRSTTDQPMAHLISHMLSGTKAQIAIKIYGENLDELRRLGGEVRDRLGDLVESEDIVDLRVEAQVLIPQLQIRLDRERLALRGLTPRAVNHVVETAMNGRVVSRYLEGEASFDIVVRFDEPYRKDMESLKQTAITLPSGGTIPLEDVADILPDRMGPNTIKRENARRRIVVSCNIRGRSLSEMRDEIRNRLTPLAVDLRELGPDYFIEYGGQFESEEAATRLMGWLSLLSLAGMFLVLYTLFKSVNLVLQVMAVLPMAAIGAVAALLLSGQSLSVPSMVGFVSLAGIASRNGILLITHYMHLVRHEGEAFTKEMVVRAGQERLAPVLMTALTSGIGLVPIVLAGNEPGKEILYPVAIIIVGGLISSTLLEFFVHPALFWTFGRKSAEQLTAETTLDLSDEAV